MFAVAVRTLCEFSAREGDLTQRFTPAPSAAEGQEGHRLVAARRGAGYETEVRLCGRCGELEVRGRADGFDAAQGRVEEIKTHRGRLERQPQNQRALHWAQAKVYGWLICERDGREAIDVALVYLDIDRGAETVFVERCDAAELKAHFERRCAAFVDWARREAGHRAARDAWLGALAFPLPEWRRGQRTLAEAVYRAARHRRPLLAQAPTGIGKTLGTLFPMLKAAATQGLDRVFFVTAKTSGREVALQALAPLKGPLRVLELVALSKSCEHPDKACDGASCPLARGFFDRLPAARRAALELPRGAALERPLWDRAAVRALAAEHAICPYWLTHELARWSDVIVGDYNHVFDTSALLHRLALEQGWRVGLLVDEAHNLVARARAMHSATLAASALKTAGRLQRPALKRPWARLRRRWNETLQAHAGAYAVLPGQPEPLLQALRDWCTAVNDLLAEQPDGVAPELLEFFFEALQLVKLADDFGGHSFFDLEREAGDARLTLRNVTPAPFTAPRFAACHASVLFSGTLQPADYHRRMLGLPEDSRVLEIEAPFSADQLDVRWLPLSTRWQRRTQSLDAIAGCIERQFSARPGNYLAFFGGYDYLQQAAERLRARCPGLPLWTQTRSMSEGEQAAFVDRFRAGGQGIGFAVLGGSFSEGIDLPGERLVGAFVATLGLPFVGPVNEALRLRIDTLFGSGFEFVYLYPGLQRVVQAAGRVIRGPEDRGVLHLIDDRYGRPDVRALLPAWWQLRR